MTGSNNYKDSLLRRVHDNFILSKKLSGKQLGSPLNEQSTSLFTGPVTNAKQTMQINLEDPSREITADGDLTLMMNQDELVINDSHDIGPLSNEHEFAAGAERDPLDLIHSTENRTSQQVSTQGKQ